MYGSPMVSSTPGGIDIGVRPSLDGFDVDAENCRRAAGAAAAGAELWKAGTRKEGRVITDEGDSALALLGASIVAVAVVAVLYGDRVQRSNHSAMRRRKCDADPSFDPGLEN